MSMPSYPDHVAIIMDGNGRWAVKQGLPRVSGHQEGVKAAMSVIDAAIKRNIKQLTLFALSTENANRPLEEVDAIILLMCRIIDEQAPHLNDKGVKLRFVGDLNFFAADVRASMASVEEKTRGNHGMELTILLNYSGRWHIESAASQMLSAAKDGSEVRDFSHYIDALGCKEPDLLIRTGGELRISNFMLWHMAYTELYFSPLLWPDFHEAAFDVAIADFIKRQRRFGQVTEQGIHA